VSRQTTNLFVQNPTALNTTTANHITPLHLALILTILVIQGHTVFNTTTASHITPPPLNPLLTAITLPANVQPKTLPTLTPCLKTSPSAWSN
jgi:hypothetical protein